VERLHAFVRAGMLLLLVFTRSCCCVHAWMNRYAWTMARTGVHELACMLLQRCNSYCCVHACACVRGLAAIAYILSGMTLKNISLRKMQSK
jgi:hypothetical protein